MSYRDPQFLMFVFGESPAFLRKGISLFPEPELKGLKLGSKLICGGIMSSCAFSEIIWLNPVYASPNDDNGYDISDYRAIMSEMGSIGRKEYPGITMVVFRNYQWGAEKRNTTLWYDDNFVGTELHPELSYAKIAEGCGLKGVAVRTQDELKNAIAESCEAQKKGESFSGVWGIAMQDASLQESMGPIVDRSKERLVPADSGIIKARQKLRKTAIALRDEGVTPPGVDTAHHRVRSAAVVLPKEEGFLDAVTEAVSVRPGMPQASV